MRRPHAAILSLVLATCMGAVEPVEPQLTRPQLADPGEYQMKDGVVEIDISEYAGYSGLIVANHGLVPNPDSYFSKTLGIKVRLSLSESDSSDAINSGKIAAGATTVDVLAVHGSPFQVSTPVLMSYSRGADGIIVRSDINTLNDLKGKSVAIQQNCEAEFFLRYLVRETGIPARYQAKLGDKPDPASVNLVCYEDPFLAGDAFSEELAGQRRLAGCVTWAPKTTEIVQQAKGAARQLIDNSNFLLIADILVVNRMFAEKNPRVVAALTNGILWGNQQVVAQPGQHLPVIGAAFGWDGEKAKAELEKVHLANLPENLAFFTDDLDQGGSFPDIFLVAQGCYEHIIQAQDDPGPFYDPKPLAALRVNPIFANERANLVPKRRGAVAVETPILNKQIHFRFLPEQAVLDGKGGFNDTQLKGMEQMLRFSVGATIILVGHVDPSQKQRIQEQGGAALLREASEAATRLSIKRAKAIQEMLVKNHRIDPSRIKTKGEGWNRPTSTKPEENMRVEMNLLMVE